MSKCWGLIGDGLYSMDFQDDYLYMIECAKLFVQN